MEITHPDGTEVSFKYGPLGRRIEKQSPERAVHFLWDALVVILGTTNQRPEGYRLFIVLIIAQIMGYITLMVVEGVIFGVEENLEDTDN